MSEWKLYKLGEIARFQTGKLNSNAAIEGGKYPFFTCSPTTLHIDNYAFDQEAILLAGNNAEGNFSIKYYNGKFNAYQRTYVIEAITEYCETRYLFYSLKLYLQHFKYISQGTSTKFLTASILRNIPISLPPLETQKRIADILSAIDDKIELNRRINANLEQQAQALYKSWFVDFEPFGGKMPEDWREGTLGEIAEFRRGKGILGKDTIKGNIPVVAGGLEPAYYHNLANTKAPVVTISASGANAGFMRMYNVDVWASDCSYIDSRCANLLWTYCYLKINAQLLKHAQTGAVQPHVKASDVNAFEIIIPSSENILNFQQKVKPIFDQIANNERENIHLAQLRDTLLPKLMSGEITV